MKTLRRTLVFAALAVLAFGLLAPYWRADRLRPSIQAALEAELNRPVHIESVHLNLFTGPGFTVDQVTIDDDPAAGIEPFAFVETMQARIRLTSLLAGKLAFSSLRLEAPSVNLVKTQKGGWNIQPLLDRTSRAGPARPRDVPDIQIRDGRLNFKFGDTKSVFYISSADVDVYPNEAGDLVIRFSGAPARADRSTQAFGQLSARGLLRAGAAGEDQLNLGLNLERTAISELMRLFNGRDIGVHGYAIAEGKLSGPLSKLEISGSLNINDVHRWDLMPAKGDGWTLRYRGLLDLSAHRLAVETIAGEGQPQPLSISFALADYLSSPKWSARLMFRDLAAASLVETARHMGAAFPPGVQVDGKVQGDIEYSDQGGPTGELVLQNASVKSPYAGTGEFESARFQFSNNRIALAPAAVQLENGQSAQIEGEYSLDNSHTALKITTRQLTIAEVESGAKHVAEASPIPLLENLAQGTWKGWIAFERSDEGQAVWSGEYDLQNAVVTIAGLASPVRFAGSVEMNKGQIQINRVRGRVGSVRLAGDYQYDPAAGRPHRLHLTIPELQLAELERLLLPALRRDEGFLARTFRLRQPAIPKWLQDLEADASLEIESLLNGDALIGQLRAHLVWDGPSIVLSDVECRLDEMSATGKVNINLTQSLPSYQLTGNVQNLDYHNGQLDLDGELETSGIGDSVLLNVRSEGTFEGRNIALGPDNVLREIIGSYRVAPSSGIPRLLLSNVQAVQGADTLMGQGSSQSDGRLVLELTSGRRQVRLTGALLPMHTEPVSGR